MVIPNTKIIVKMSLLEISKMKQLELSKISKIVETRLDIVESVNIMFLIKIIIVFGLMLVSPTPTFIPSWAFLDAFISPSSMLDFSF